MSEKVVVCLDKFRAVRGAGLSRWADRLAVATGPLSLALRVGQSQGVGELSFGQPTGAVIQMAYVVPDLTAAIEDWIRDIRVGPWFRFQGFDGGADAVYRGGPSRARVDLAMAFSGHIQIELIQPLDQEPSVYRDTVLDRGFGFHHFGVASDDVDADMAALESNGYEVAFVATVPTGNRVVYMDGGPGRAGMIELIPTSGAMQEMWGRYYRAAVSWDGTDPVRPFG